MTKKSQPLELHILEGQEVKLGETVEIRARLRNVGSAAVSIREPRENETVEIRWGTGDEELKPVGFRMFIHTIGPVTRVLAPGEELVFVTRLSPNTQRLPDKPGIYRFQIVYFNPTEDLAGQKVWTGEIKSPSVTVLFVESVRN